VKEYQTAVIGSGPAGLAAAAELSRLGISHVVIERESQSGGILKQCIHDGFGLQRFKERLTGPEYAERFLKEAIERNIEILNDTFVSDIKNDNGFTMTLVNPSEGIFRIKAQSLILANGCRERTAKQINIHGTRPSGVYTAGTAQYFINILGYMPFKKCVILGSGDIGLIMARRLTLEGAEVTGVYEAKSTPSGLTRNISQCLEDFDIPLHLSKTVTKVYGDDKLTGVEIADVDEKLMPIKGTERYIECDTLILSVGLIPENELAKSLDIPIDLMTNGPVVDEKLMTMSEGVFSCGNALHVNDLVDYVSDTGEAAARGAAEYVKSARRGVRQLADVKYNNSEIAYVVPQKVNRDFEGTASFYFRSRCIEENRTLYVKIGNEIVFKKKYSRLLPPEMEAITLELKKQMLDNADNILFYLE